MLDLHSSVPTVVLSLTILLLPLLIFSRFLGGTIARRLFHPGQWQWLRRLQHKPIQSSEIVSLRMYPIKSCRGFEVQQTTLRQHGLDIDRRWMLVDASTREFLTIRQIPEMTRIGTALSDDGAELVISIPDSASQQQQKKKTIRVPAHPSSAWLVAHTTLAQVRIWDIDTDGYIYGTEINDPFTTFLGRPVALVYKGPTPRVLRGNGAPRILGREQTTGFADVHPVLIASEDSLAELNTRLQRAGVDPITVERFRPNIVVRGGLVPWSEDSWKVVRIIQRSAESSKDEAVTTATGVPDAPPLDLDIVARCARCQVPNVDPDTAVKHKSQPWDTLVSYRRVDEGIKYKPCFGVLSAPRSEGVVRVGMQLEVLEETGEHRYITGF